MAVCLLKTFPFNTAVGKKMMTLKTYIYRIIEHCQKPYDAKESYPYKNVQSNLKNLTSAAFVILHLS